MEEIGYDPVEEYTKSVDNFEIHFRPSSDDLFRIVFQLSRFFRELSDLETEDTASFRHPPVRGDKELEELGIKGELDIMEMLGGEGRGEVNLVLKGVETLNVDIKANY